MPSLTHFKDLENSVTLLRPYLPSVALQLKEYIRLSNCVNLGSEKKKQKTKKKLSSQSS